MIEGNVTGLDRLDRLIGRVAAMENPALDPLAERLRPIITQGMRRLAESGRDVNGKELARPSAKTLRNRGPGEALHPSGRNPFAESFRLDLLESSPGRLSLLLRWDHPAARITQTGTAHQPARDIFGVDEATLDEIRDEVKRFGFALASDDGGDGRIRMF